MRGIPLPEVELRDTYIEKEGILIKMPQYKTIFNPVTERPFAIASNKYKLVKHEEVMENVEDTIEQLNTYGKYSKVIKLDKEGARLRTTYTFKDMELPVGDANKGDLINPTIEVFNSYDLSWRHTVMIGAFRMVCTNGMVVGEEFMSYKKKHIQNLYLDDVKRALEGGLEQMQTQVTQWNSWQNIGIEKDEAEKIIDKMQLNGKEKEELINVKEVFSNISLGAWLTFKEITQVVITKWIFFNIITQYITHNIKHETRKVQLETAFRRNMYR